MGRSSSEGCGRASAGRIGGKSENSSHLDLGGDNHHSIADQGLEFHQIIDCLLANESTVEIQHGEHTEEQRSWSNQAPQRIAFYFAEAQRLGHMGGWVFDPAIGFDY